MTKPAFTGKLKAKVEKDDNFKTPRLSVKEALMVKLIISGTNKNKNKMNQNYDFLSMTFCFSDCVGTGRGQQCSLCTFIC
jgi:hypothetical protein